MTNFLKLFYLFNSLSQENAEYILFYLDFLALLRRSWLDVACEPQKIDFMEFCRMQEKLEKILEKFYNERG